MATIHGSTSRVFQAPSYVPTTTPLSPRHQDITKQVANQKLTCGRSSAEMIQVAFRVALFFALCAVVGFGVYTGLAYLGAPTVVAAAFGWAAGIFTYFGIA